MSINNTNDIINYLEEKIFAHDIFKMSPKEAIISTASFVQSEYSIFEKDTNNYYYTFEKLRNGQDILKYSLYHIYSNKKIYKPPKKVLKDFDWELYDLYKNFSIIHDLIMSVKIRKFDVSIDNESKTILFNLTNDAIIDEKRNHEILIKKIQREIQARSNFDLQEQLEIQNSFNTFFSNIEIDKNSQELKFQLDDNIVKVAYNYICKVEPNYFTGPNLPDIDLGLFSSKDFKIFWRYLQTFALIQDLAYKNNTSSLKTVNKKSSLFTIGKKNFISQMVHYSRLKKETIQEIYKDLLYNPLNISWTEPQYQPIIEIDSQFILLIPLIILSNNYERNYTALIEKLPWRKKERIMLKESRENSMSSRIVTELKELGLKSKDKVKLKRGNKLVSDIDLVIWNETQNSIFAISLKWFYGPDSVQEVINHSIRYRETNDQQKIIIDYLKENFKDLKTKCKMKLSNKNKPRIYPLIIYEKDMPLNSERKKDLPATTIERFLGILIQKKSDLKNTFKTIQIEYNDCPKIKIKLQHTEIEIGEYKFLIPYSLVRNSPVF